MCSTWIVSMRLPLQVVWISIGAEFTSQYGSVLAVVAGDELEVLPGMDDECRQQTRGSEHTCTFVALQRRATGQRHDITTPAMAMAGSPARAFAAVPAGVNLGGWFVLEDWMFSGETGRHVASIGTSGQGTCLPPLLWSLDDTPWQSEGLLTKQLVDTQGQAKALDIIYAHRKAYIAEEDFRKISSLGIRSVRLPLPWSTFADALSALDAEAYRQDAKVVPDPFYDQAWYVTVDRDMVQKVVQQAARHNLKVVLELHYMPGGANDGTYNGIWPLPPKFWTSNATRGAGDVKLTQVGLWVAHAFVKWVEGLDELGSIEGITLLNEPGHMASIDKANGRPFTFSEKQILQWVADAADLFRQSALPLKGIKLYVNMVEPAFDNFWDTVPPWYMQTFTAHERHSWAVFDIHWYVAWGNHPCSGRIEPGAGYLCSQPADEIRPLLNDCIHSAMALFAKKVDGLKACGEFSAATFEDPTRACHGNTLKVFLEEQLRAFEDFEIEGFFWTWRMPYGKNFENAWSYSKIAGVETAASAEFARLE
mmetsp:Transcript_3482/g.8753  ORF Transcript_3482/g.8753 Transcript_3482/m.8753 type:complete len:536 (-) Transcript_3482:254-1861(-)